MDCTSWHSTVKSQETISLLASTWPSTCIKPSFISTWLYWVSLCWTLILLHNNSQLFINCFFDKTLQYLENLYNSATFSATYSLKHTIHKYSLFSATNHVTSECNITPSCEISGSHSSAEEDLNSPSTQYHINWYKMTNTLGRLLSLSSPPPLHKQLNE